MLTTTVTRLKTAAAIAGILASAPLLALPPGTRTPDQMVNLQLDKNTLCPAFGFAVNQQVNADGTLSPFSIPAGYTLQITGLDWFNYTRGGTEALSRWEAMLTIQGAGTAVIYSDFSGNTSGTTYQGHSVTGINDVVVRPGVTLCYGQPAWTATKVSGIVIDTRANVHGYLVKDRSPGSNDNGNNDGGSSKGGGSDWKSR